MVSFVKMEGDSVENFVQNLMNVGGKKGNRAMDQSRENEIDRNYIAFKTMLPKLLEEHLGKYALMKARAVVAFYESAGDAERAGAKAFLDGLYSVQLVSSEPVDLGFYSYVLAQGTA